MSITNYPDADFTPNIPNSIANTGKQSYNPTGSFRFWAQKVLPTVYDDSLSYYEILTKVVNYLNAVIQNVDSLNESVDNTNSAFDDLQAYVNTSKNTLIMAYNKLQSYVNTYFDSLDIQEEINTKLDGMASDGSLSELLAPFIPSVVSDWLSENITPTSPAIDASLSVSGAAADAKTTGDFIRTNSAELTGIHVGADGTQYETAGDAVRTQITNLKSELNSETDFLILEQGAINTYGYEVESLYRVRTVTKITRPMFIKTPNDTIMVMAYIVYNASTDDLVSYNALTNQTSVSLTPESGTYIRVTFKKRDDSELSVLDIQPTGTILDINDRLTDAGKVAVKVGTLEKNSIETKGIHFYTNYYVATGAGGEHAVINTTPFKNSSFSYFVEPCSAGDVFEITGVGGDSPRLWCFVDNKYRRLSVAVANANESGLTLKAEKDGYLIVNVSNESNYSATVTRTSKVGNIVHITNPHELFWKMGRIAPTGQPVVGDFHMSFWAKVRVKAGSRVWVNREDAIELQVGYKYVDSSDDLEGSTTALDYYQTFGYHDLTVDKDCTLYVCAQDFTPVTKYNNSIIDAVHVDIYAVDFEPKYSKTKLFNFGTPAPVVYYEGQHEDVTGWTNDTTDVNAIHSAYDALVTDSNGFITKTDLGVTWSTYHMYAYTTNPVGSHIRGLRVPKIVILCGLHGDEKMSCYCMHYMLYDLLYNATKNPVLSYLRANCQIVVVPVTNPWGFVNKSRNNENGVNLNRNWPIERWSEWTADDESDPTQSEVGGNNYKGSSAGSEEQIKILTQFLYKNYDATLVIDLHTNGTNTAGWYEISHAGISVPATHEIPGYSVLNSYTQPQKDILNYVKPWLDEKYGTNLGNVYYGNQLTNNTLRPSTETWVRECLSIPGLLYEVMAGSKDGYLGTNLTWYSADTIKASAETFGNFMMAMLAHASVAK